MNKCPLFALFSLGFSFGAVEWIVRCLFRWWLARFSFVPTNRLRKCKHWANKQTYLSTWITSRSGLRSIPIIIIYHCHDFRCFADVGEIIDIVCRLHVLPPSDVTAAAQNAKTKGAQARCALPLSVRLPQCQECTSFALRELLQRKLMFAKQTKNRLSRSFGYGLGAPALGRNVQLKCGTKICNKFGLAERRAKTERKILFTFSRNGMTDDKTDEQRRQRAARDAFSDHKERIHDIIGIWCAPSKYQIESSGMRAADFGFLLGRPECRRSVKCMQSAPTQQ